MADEVRSAEVVRFPKDFLWGAATSSHQVEGDNHLNDWWQWEQANRDVEPSGDACDHFRRYEDDFDLVKDMHHSMHRFSIEWSRVQPQIHLWDDQAFQHYRDVISALRQREIEPVVTLHHFTNPRWMAERGGWEQPRSVKWFADYVRRVTEELGEGVRYWVTINEPTVLALHGYVVGNWPPQVQSLSRARDVMRHLVLAHGEAYHAIHEVAGARQWPRPMVSQAKSWYLFTPHRPNSRFDRFTCWLRHALYDRLPVEASHRSRWPALVLGDVGGARNTMDYLALNYYTRDFVRFGSLSLREGFGVKTSQERSDRGPTNDLGWEIYPEGMYQMLSMVRQYQLPVLITENGLCTTDDEKRWSFIRAHLIQLHRAMQTGIKVLGYHYWSLLDNFEWAEGFAPRFGLLRMDYDSQTRKMTSSATRYAEVCRTGEVPVDGDVVDSAPAHVEPVEV